jgi:hypothetical protein
MDGLVLQETQADINLIFFDLADINLLNTHRHKIWEHITNHFGKYSNLS